MKQDRTEKQPNRHAAPRVSGNNQGMYVTVGNEMRNLHRAVEGTARDKWTIIRESALTGRFEKVKK